MRTLLLTLSALLLISIVGMYSCTKEKSETATPAAALSDEQIVSQVNWFMDAAKEVKEGKYLKSREKMELDSALYYISATLNYKYGYATEPFGKLKLDTVMVNIPYIASEGKTYIVDALEGYNITIEKIRLKYLSIVNSKKVLIGCVIQNAGLTNNNDSIKVRVIAEFGSGQAAPVYFDPTDEYWWHRDSWRCDLTGEEGAPNIFENNLNFAWRPAPPPGYRVTFTGLSLELFENPTLYLNPTSGPIDNFCDYEIFFATSLVSVIDEQVKCLGTDPAHPGIQEMEYYMDGMESVLGGFLQSQNQNFFSLSIESPEKTEYNIVTIKHMPKLTYGIRHIIAIDPSAVYPMSIMD